MNGWLALLVPLLLLSPKLFHHNHTTPAATVATTDDELVLSLEHRQHLLLLANVDLELSSLLLLLLPNTKIEPAKGREEKRREEILERKLQVLV